MRDIQNVVAVLQVHIYGHQSPLLLLFLPSILLCAVLLWLQVSHLSHRYSALKEQHSFLSVIQNSLGPWDGGDELFRLEAE